jgi:hypothetical protein
MQESKEVLLKLKAKIDHQKTIMNCFDMQENFQSKGISYKDWKEANFWLLATDNINSLKNRGNPPQVIPEFFMEPADEYYDALLVELPL